MVLSFITSQEAALERRQNLFGDEILNTMFGKIMLKILMVSAWLSLAFGSSQSNEVVDNNYTDDRPRYVFSEFLIFFQNLTLAGFLTL